MEEELHDTEKAGISQLVINSLPVTFLRLLYSRVIGIQSNILFHSFLIIFFILFFLLVYSPVTQGRYFVGEEYNLVWTSTHSSVSQQSYLSYVSSFQFEGRPLEILYLYVAYIKYINPLKSIEAANTVRFISIIGVGLLAYVLFLIFKENRFKTAHAFLLSILICTLPPFPVFVSRANIAFFVYSVLLSALSALILFKVVFKEERKKITHIAIAVLISIVLFVIASNIYQPSAMTYWAMAVVPLVMLKNEDLIKKWRLPFTVYFSTGFAALIIYFISTKIIISILGDYNAFPEYIKGRGVFISLTIADIKREIIEFIRFSLYTALNLWNIFPTKTVGLSVGAVILAGFLLGIGDVKRQVMVKGNGLNLSLNLLCKYLLFLIILPLSFLPYPVIKEGFRVMVPKSRALVALDITVLLLFYWGLMNIAEFFKSKLNFSADLQKKIIITCLTILTLVAVFSAHHNVDKYFVKLYSDELRYIEDVIQEYGVSNLSKDSRIYVINSDREAKDYFGEFSGLSSIGRGASVLMVKQALFELGMSSDISVGLYDEVDHSISIDNNILIVDMRDFQKQAYKRMNIPLSVQPLF